MRFERRYAWWAASAAAIALLLFWMIRPETVSVETAPAAVGPLAVTVGDEGQTRVRNRHVVTAPVSGRLDRIALQVGDPIRPGMVVARLLPLALDARSRQRAEAALAASRDLERSAAAAVGEARTGLEQARADRERAERLLTSGGIAPADVERLQRVERARERELDAAEGRAAAAAHEVEVARSALMAADPASAAGARGGGLSLTCPFGGRVLALPERSARTVAAGEPILEIGDPGDLEVVVDLLSADAVKVEPGMPMLLTGWGGDSALAGRVRRVEPSGFTKVSALGVEEQRVNVVGDLIAPPPSLGDRFRVDVRIVLWEADSVLRVPSSALFRRGSGWALFVVEDGRARERPVTIGHESQTEAEVVKGIASGDRIIRHPTDQVRDGVRVSDTSVPR